MLSQLQWNLDLTNLYITKSSVKWTIFFTPIIVKNMNKNLDVTKPRYNEQFFSVPWRFVNSRFHCTKIVSLNVDDQLGFNHQI